MEMISATTETIAGVRKPEAQTVDERHMLRAVELAELGRRTASPNPAVGAVVVRDGLVVGEGFHERPGKPHAEVHALEQAGARARGADVYVTLEPCSHHGRTPPCADMLVSRGVGRVVIAMRDPNPRVAGRGIEVLSSAGIQVEEGVLEGLAGRLNEAYVKWITTSMPFVTLKMAMSLDGRSATRTGDSKWVSSEPSRLDVHEERARSDAVMVGLGTVIADDPRLTARGVGASRQPMRVVVDGAAGIPLQRRVTDISEAPTAVAVASDAPGDRVAELKGRGLRVIVSGSDGLVDLRGLLEELGSMEVTSVLAEGGPTLAASLVEEGLVDKLVMYVAPMVAGGREAPGPVGGQGVELMRDAVGFRIDSVREFGPDIRVVSYPAGG